ncbi:MAG TPA: hypothetical protein VL859_02260 [Flavobacterium sp.]|nr:hypothetical protein [Flavobacterium sp.]
MIDTDKIFAIYKNGKHLGNEKAINEKEAIKKYLIAALFIELINDPVFISKYNAIEAIKGTHHY